MPSSLIGRKNQGFDPSIGRWLGTGLRDRADGFLGELRLKRTGPIHPHIMALSLVIGISTAPVA